MTTKQHTDECGHVTPSRKYALDNKDQGVYDDGIRVRRLVQFLFDSPVSGWPMLSSHGSTLV